MKRFFLGAIILSLASLNAHAQPPPVGYIGLYVDESRSSNEVWNTGGIKEFTMYVFCLPSEHGMAAVEFSIDYPLNVVQDTVIYSPDVVVTLGTLNEGISIDLFGCYFEWKWVLKQRIYLTDTAPSRIAIAPHGSAGVDQFASCLEGFPLEPAYVASSICLNSSSCPADTSRPVLTGATTISLKRVNAVFNEPLFQPSAEDTANYEVFETLAPSVSLHVSRAELLAGRESAMLYLREPLSVAVSYTVRVSGVKDVAGNEIAPGSETQFIGDDHVPPGLMSATALSDSEVALHFNEPVTVGSAEQANNFCIGTSSPPPCPVTPVSAVLSDETTVRLSLSVKLPGVTSYYLYVSNVEDLAGNVIAANSFVILHVGDFYPPRILSAAALDMRHIKALFSEVLDPLTALHAGNYTVFKRSDTTTAVPVDSVAFSGTTATVKVVVRSDLEVEIPYVLRVCVVKDQHNNPIVCPGDAIFVVPDVYPPVLLSARAPADTAADVVFNEPLDPATAERGQNYAIFRTGHPAETLPVSGASLAADSNVVRLALGDSLVDDLQYTVTVSGVKDRKGNTIGAGSAAFLVYPDTFPPQMTGVFPYDELSVMVGFNEQVLRNQAENVSNYTLALEKDTTQTIDVMIALLAGGHRFARIVFAHRLAEGELYRLTARNIADLKGNVSPVLRRYFAFVDVYPPELVLARARGRANVDVFFSEPVDHLTGATPSNYSLFPRGNPASPLPITGAAMRGDSSIVRLSLDDTLVAGALYTLRVSGVADRQHNVIAPESEIDVIPPDSIPPSLEAVRAASFNTVVVRFSEPVARFTAQDTTNYRVYAPSNPGDSPKLAGALLLDDSVTVKLSLGSGIVLWRTYKVRANNIEDLATNIIGTNSEKSFVCSPLPEKGAIGLFADTQRQQSSVYLAGGQITEFTMYLFSYPSQEGQRDLEFAIKYPSNVTQGVFAVNDAVVASSVGEPALGVEAHLRECNYDWIWTHRQTCYLLDSQKSTVGIVRHPAAGAYGFRSCLSGNPFEGVDILTHLYCNCTYNPGTLLKEFAAGYRDECIEITWCVSQIDDAVAFIVSRAVGGGGVFTPRAAGAIEVTGAAFRFVDRDIEHGASYRYRVGFVDESGSHVLFETDEIETPSLRLALYQNVPNPFNPSTTIRYYLPRSSTVVLEIYDVSGRRVARLIDGPQREGRHETAWDGTADSGTPVSSGIYLCRLQAGKETLSRKMVLLR